LLEQLLLGLLVVSLVQASPVFLEACEGKPTRGALYTSPKFMFFSTDTALA
jgi:hypothetical protein